MNIGLRQLNVFMRVAQEKTITAAAEKLFLSKPAVSMALSELENQLGQQLFDRQNNRLVINEFGLKLQPLADELLARSEQISGLFSQGNQLTGSLKIGASDTIGTQVIPYLLRDFRDKTLHKQQSLLISNTADICQRIAKFELDIALVEGKVGSNHLVSIAWLSDEMCLICSSDHPLSQVAKPTFAQLESQYWLLREQGSGTRSYFSKHIAPQLNSWKLSLELNNTEAIINCVSAGLGIACISKLAVTHAFKNSGLIMLTLPVNYQRQYWLVYHKEKCQLNLMANFVDFCKNWRVQ
jgi:DNA-binding transcriptional LysR family regulator